MQEVTYGYRNDSIYMTGSADSLNIILDKFAEVNPEILTHELGQETTREVGGRNVKNSVYLTAKDAVTCYERGEIDGLFLEFGLSKKSKLKIIDSKTLLGSDHPHAVICYSAIHSDHFNYVNDSFHNLARQLYSKVHFELEKSKKPSPLDFY